MRRSVRGDCPRPSPWLLLFDWSLCMQPSARLGSGKIERAPYLRAVEADTNVPSCPLPWAEQEICASRPAPRWTDRNQRRAAHYEGLDCRASRCATLDPGFIWSTPIEFGG